MNLRKITLAALFLLHAAVTFTVLLLLCAASLNAQPTPEGAALDVTPIPAAITYQFDTRYPPPTPSLADLYASVGRAVLLLNRADGTWSLQRELADRGNNNAATWDRAGYSLYVLTGQSTLAVTPIEAMSATPAPSAAVRPLKESALSRLSVMATLPPTPQPAATVPPPPAVAMLNEGITLLAVIPNVVTNEPPPLSPELAAQCTEADILNSRAWGLGSYGFLAMRCWLHGEWRTSGSGHFAVHLANHGLPSPGARCSYLVVFRVAMRTVNSAGNPVDCDCEGIDDEGIDKPVKRLMTEPDYRQCGPSCDDTVGFERGLLPVQLTSSFSVSDDRDPAEKHEVTCAGLDGADFKGHGQCAGFVQLACRPEPAKHIVIDRIAPKN